MKLFKPMLAKDADLTKLRFPLIASPKLDGVRATVINGVLMSRSLKPIPNKHIQSLFANCEYFDGELIVGDPTSKTTYKDTVSEVMSHDRTNGCRFFVFDHIERTDLSFEDRHLALSEDIDNSNVITLEQKRILTLVELSVYEEYCLELGYEGLITRAPDTAYKFGRASENSQELNKIKRFKDSEAWIIGFEERLHNANAATVNELGRTQRSSHAAGKVPMGTLGALKCKLDDGTEFNIGTGFDDTERQHIWNNQDKFLDRLAKFKYFPIGMDKAPRHPVYLGMRAGFDV